ncbi:MAG: uncharacterized protein K0R24_516 [Gammaproteobacteria bacterium]|jgi:hypothetical protein|nr:uncharacterized protein [Gammaproteobacteria bacterium]MCE3237535.1 uncharacterized protein [Gammaproteobacteria bacterium]
MLERAADRTILTVYFSGTEHDINNSGTSLNQGCLASLLYKKTQTSENQLKKGFSGCGITNGFRGGIFGDGLKSQALEVKQQVVTLLKEGRRVRLNCYGHSRGAIAALMLAQMLGNFDADLVEVNLVLLDTVPGNLITSAKLDIFSRTLANQVMDLSKCKNLKRVLSLYTNKPLPDLLFHAPLLPCYPSHSEVKEDVLPGCHAGVQFQRQHAKNIFFDNQQCFLTFIYIAFYLSNCGTQLNAKDWGWWIPITDEPDSQLTKLNNLGDIFLAVEDIYQKEKDKLQEAVRSCHSTRGVKIKTDPTQPYVNLYHKDVLQKKGRYEEKEDFTRQEDTSDLAISITPSQHNRIDFSKFVNDSELKVPENIMELFKRFIQSIHIGMSDDSRNSTKGNILSSYISEEKISFENKAQLKHAIRNILALALQRDRNALSFFSTTTSGYVALHLLQQPQYQQFAELILGTAEHTIRYRDLRMFVLGENNAAYFYMKNRDKIYHTIFKTNMQAEKPAISADLTVQYLNRL